MTATAQLRALLIDGTLPGELAGFGKLFKATLNYFYPDDLPEDGSIELGEWRCLPEDPVELTGEDPEFAFLQGLGPLGAVPIIQRCLWARREGITYRPSNGTTDIDSHLEVRIGKNTFAARIDSIVLFTMPGARNRTRKLLALLSIHQPPDASIRAKSPYARFPELGVYLVRDAFLQQKQMVPITSFHCPIAVCPFVDETPELNGCTVVVPIRTR